MQLDMNKILINKNVPMRLHFSAVRFFDIFKTTQIYFKKKILINSVIIWILSMEIIFHHSNMKYEEKMWIK